MNNAELIAEQKLKQKKIIAILRRCGSNKGCYKCPLAGKSLGTCTKILRDAADAIEAAEKRIAELEAQLPKEGEWIPNSPFTGNCSECGGNGNLKDKYCSNCGAKMKGGQK